MTRPEWETQQPGKRMTRREMLTQLLLMVDAFKRMESINISGLTARPGFEASWDSWVQIADFLRTEMKAEESIAQPSALRKSP